MQCENTTLFVQKPKPKTTKTLTNVKASSAFSKLREQPSDHMLRKPTLSATGKYKSFPAEFAFMVREQVNHKHDF